jgi:hypothetical protein
MAGHSSISKEQIQAVILAKPFELSAKTHGILIAFILIGIASFVCELVLGEAMHAWMALHVNFTYWFCAAAAASCFSAVFHICNAQWARPIIRLFQSTIVFFKWSPLFLVLLYFGHHNIFEWAHHALPGGKGVWLSGNFLYLRDILSVLVMIYLANKVIYYSLRRDLGIIRSGVTGLSSEQISRWANSSYDSFVKSWNSDSKVELADIHQKLWNTAPFVVIVYSISMSLFAFDQIMSVDPHWYSTLYGGFYFMTGVYLCMAMMSILLVLVRKSHPVFIENINKKTLHDLGKLLFGFGIFWAYLFWSHYLPIWYGNMPEETGFIILRLRKEPWHTIAWMVFGLSFIIPFFLGLSRDIKQIPILLLATAGIVSVGIWLQQYLLFAPTLYPEHLPFSMTDVGIAIGFFGLFFLSCASFLKRVPLMPIGDIVGDY